MIVVNGWSWEVATALVSSHGFEVCVVDGDNGADHMVRVLERNDMVAHLVEPQRAAAAVGECDAVVVSAAFLGPETAWSPVGSAQLAAVAYCEGADVMLTTAVGTRLPKMFSDAITRLIDDNTRGQAWHRDVEAVPLALVTTVVGAAGAENATALLARGIAPEAPTAAELTVRSAM